MSNGDARFTATLYSKTPFDTEQRARELLSALLLNPTFAPNRFGECEPYEALTSERFEDAVALVVNRTEQQLNPGRVSSLVFFKRTLSPRCSYYIEWSRLPHLAFDTPGVSVEEGYIGKADHLREWLNFVFGLLPHFAPWYARFATAAEQRQKNTLHWHHVHPRAANPEKGVESYSGVGVKLEQGIPGVYWGNYFGPFYVEWLGREKLETLPCVEKEWLDTGGVFFTTAPTPFEWDTPEARQVEQAVREHLGSDAFFDMDQVRRRLAMLEPIPEGMEPEQLQSPRRVPVFPFKIEGVQHRSLEEETQQAKQFFASRGYAYLGMEKEVLVFEDGRGGKLRLLPGPGGALEYWPKQ